MENITIGKLKINLDDTYNINVDYDFQLDLKYQFSKFISDIHRSRRTQNHYIVFEQGTYKTELTITDYYYQVNYYNNGELHRNGGYPAIIRFHNNYMHNDNPVSILEYYYNGKLHRPNDKPAIVYYDSYGKISQVVYCINGEKHRNGDKPAVINFHNGILYNLSYYNHGKLNRDNHLPAIIEFKASKDLLELKCVKYYNNNFKTAEISFNDNQQFYIQYDDESCMKYDRTTINIFDKNYTIDISDVTSHLWEPILKKTLDIPSNIELNDYTSEHIFDYIYDLQSMSMKTYLTNCVNNVIFIYKDKNKYQTKASTFEQLLNTENFFVKCLEDKKRKREREIFMPSLNNIDNFQKWYVGNFIDLQYGLSFDCVKKIINYLQLNDTKNPINRIFYIGNMIDLGNFSNVRSVQIRAGNDVFDEPIGLVSRVHCGSDTNLTVFDEIWKPLFLQNF